MKNNIKVFPLDCAPAHLQCQPGFYFNLQMQILYHRDINSIKLYGEDKNNMKIQNTENEDT